ncbi:hypothetical protein ACNQFN_10980 [Thauera butanivorans]|uniref:hypothetical protein n=1 Tax=Thauera butanivorans TaxID=86174 RepID=UPI003AB775FF
MPSDDLPRRIEATAARLEAWCRENKHWVSADGRVREATAAELVGMSAGTLRNRRCALNPVMAFYLAGGRVTYRIEDVATWLEGWRIECHSM